MLAGEARNRAAPYPVVRRHFGESSVTRTETRARLLVVDDEPGIRQVLETAFTDRGLDVSAASNGDKAIELLQEKPFDEFHFSL